MRAVGGLLAVNLLYVLTGATLLWGAHRWRFWTSLVRLGGLAYLLGVASLMVVLTATVAMGIPYSEATFLGCAALVSVAGVVVGITRGHKRPVLRPPGWKPPIAPLLALPFIAGVVLYFVWLLRAARLQSLYESDSWWVWTIRAKALVFFRDLGGDSLVGGGAGGNPSYPPGLSLVQAAAFDAMGSVDTVTLHVQHWFLLLGFVLAVVGLLAGRVRPTILYPVLLLTLVMPGFAERASATMADCLLGYLASAAALLLVLWLDDQARWRLIAATVLLAGVIVVKREGLIVVACVLFAGFVASFTDRRRGWPKLAIVGAVTVLLSASWRIRLALTDVGDAPTGGYLSFLDNPDRAWPSLRLVVQTLFDPNWLGLAIVVLLSAGLALAAGQRKVAGYTLAFLAAWSSASAFVIWSETAFEISRHPFLNPVNRMVLVGLLVLAPLAPLMLEGAWRGGRTAPTEGSTA